MCIYMRRNYSQTCFKEFRRYTHRAPDVKFIQEGQMHHVRFKDEIKEGIAEMNSYPKLMENLFKTSAAMVVQNKVPFVHGRSPMLGAIKLFVDALMCSKQKGFYQYLRQPSAQYQIERQDLFDRIDQFIKEHGFSLEPARLDHVPELRAHLVSIGYTMTSNFAFMESAYSFTFKKPAFRGNIEDIFAGVLALSMRSRGFSDKIPRVLKQMRPIFEEYNDLPVGDLLVIGIPKDKVEEYVYDSIAFGIPTGKKVWDVLDNPFESPKSLVGESGGLQARLMLYKETMTPSCGIEIVLANDDRQVEAYCQGVDLTDPRHVKAFDSILCQKYTHIEEFQKSKRKELAEKIISIAKNVIE